MHRDVDLAGLGQSQSAGAFVLDVPGRIFPLRHPRRGGFLFLDPELGALLNGSDESRADHEFPSAVDPVVDGIQSDGDVHLMSAAMAAPKVALRVDAPGADNALEQFLAAFLEK